MTSIATYELAIATARVARIVIIVLVVVDLVSMMKEVGLCGMVSASEFGKSGNPRDRHPKKTK